MNSTDEPRGVQRRLLPLAENVGEATAACLVAMVQGNLLVLSLSHWAVASRTGVAAGLAATGAIWLLRARRRWVVALVLGLVTAGVDYVMHPGMIGEAPWTEAVLTGVGAAVLSLLAGVLWRRFRGATPEEAAVRA